VGVKFFSRRSTSTRGLKPLSHGEYPGIGSELRQIIELLSDVEVREMQEEQAEVESGNDATRDSRIVVGIDGSNASLTALEWAACQAEFTGSSLEIVAAWEWPTSYGWSVIPDNYDPTGDLKRMFEPLLVALHATHPKVAVTTKIVEGHPAPVLISASHGASLLVVGSRGHGEVVGMLIGSTSEHCVAHAACPVVVFREKK
jgi:nucleotide-binding universal stress UspA family protein